MTLNVHHFEGISGEPIYVRVVNMIMAQRPDVVVLQEVDRGTNRAGGIDQAALVADRLGMHVTYGPAMDWDGGEYGAAILSRWPIAKAESHHLPFVPSLEPRQALAARVFASGGEFVILGTHLDHISPSMRAAQARELDRLAGESQIPVILAGDFNAPRTDPALHELLGSWVDAGPLKAPIDYILVQDWTVVRSWIVEDSELDHPAVVSILQWGTP